MLQCTYTVALSFWSHSKVPECIRPRDDMCMKLVYEGDSAMTNSNFEVLNGRQWSQTAALLSETEEGFALEVVGGRNKSTEAKA